MTSVMTVHKLRGHPFLKVNTAEQGAFQQLQGCVSELYSLSSWTVTLLLV